MKRTVFRKWLVILLSVFGVCYFAIQLYHIFDEPYQTEIAMEYTYENQIPLQGMMIKQEEILDTPAGDYIQYWYDNAQRVHAGAEVATIYFSGEDIQKSRELLALQKRKEQLQVLEHKRKSLFSSTQTKVSSVSQFQNQLLYHLLFQDMDGFSAAADGFTTALWEQQMMLNPEQSFGEELASVEEEIEWLTKQQAEDTISVTLPSGGYFTHNLDGYENAVTQDALQDLSLSAVQSLLQDTTPDTSLQGAVGKVVTSAEWDYVALIKTSQLSKYADAFNMGEKINLFFPSGNMEPFPVEIGYMDTDLSEEYSVMVLHGDIMNASVIDLRTEKALLCLDSGTGLRVSRDALRFDGDQVGVYVHYGQVVKFKKLDILYETEDYVISSLTPRLQEGETQNAYLRVYDQVILNGGSDLYDNKPI